MLNYNIGNYSICDLFSKQCETIVFTEEYFGKDLWVKVGEAVKLLIQAGYTCVVRAEDSDIIVIEFNYEFEEYGCSKPMWLSCDEREYIDLCRNNTRDKIKAGYKAELDRDKIGENIISAVCEEPAN